MMELNYYLICGNLNGSVSVYDCKAKNVTEALIMAEKIGYIDINEILKVEGA